MVVEYIRYKIPASDAARFEQDYAQAAHCLDDSPHCAGYELARCVEDPQSYILRIHWDSVSGHMQGFRGSAQFRSFFAAIRPYVDMIEEMRHYEPTTVRQGTAT